jgi:hypothetical protein
MKYKKSQSESGLRGARARWKQHGEPIGSPSKRHSEANGVALAKNASSSSSSSSFASSLTDRPPELPSANGNGTGLRERFETFWAAVPKRVGKDAAWRAWQKRQPSPELTEQICAALAWQTQQDNWLLEGGRFIPNPATWITAGRWQDEPTDAMRVNTRTLSIGRAGAEFLKS